jgi:two-component system response regulator MprA
MARVLVVDSDDDLCTSISDVLWDGGLEVVTVAGQSGLREALAATFDVIVLGCNLPDLTTGQFVRRLRVGRIDTPILLISTLEHEQELVDGLNLGADGYLSTPISPLVLRAQIRSLLRRNESGNHREPGGRDGETDRQVLHLGPLAVNIVAKQASLEGRFVEFSKREFALLRVLASHPHTPLSRQELLRMAWGDRNTTTPNTVEVYIGYLRKRLRVLGADQCIETRRGRGYQLNAPAASSHDRGTPPNRS